MFWDAVFSVRGRTTCFLVGHIEKMGEMISYEPDWCARCYCEWPQEKATLPTILNTGYGWLIEHSLLFVRFDDWLLQSKVNRCLPSWWEY